MKDKSLLNTRIVRILALVAIVVGAVIIGCSSDSETGESRDENGEEPGTVLALNETYDVVRKGARLILAYDAPSNSFIGTVENTTGDTLPQVRVEVHLSSGTELGPTTPVDLAPSETIDVTLPATSQAFDGWTPHAEVGAGDSGVADNHGEGSEGSEGGESGGEHGEGGD